MELLSTLYENLVDLDRRIAELEAERVDVVNRIDGLSSTQELDEARDFSVPELPSEESTVA